jgi:hypothetical protein
MGNQNHSKQNQGEGRALIALADAIRKNTQAYEDNAQKKPDQGGPWWRKAVQIIGVILGAGALGVNVLLWISTEKAVKLTRQQVHIGQRAYVIVEKARFTKPPIVGEGLSIELTLKNTGQTPAINIKPHAVIDFWENGAQPFGTPVVFGNISVFPLGSDQTRDFVAVTTEPVTQKDMDAAMQDDARIDPAKGTVVLGGFKHLSIHAILTYTDVFGGQGETQFCGWYSFSAQTFVGCPNFNSIK